MKANIQIHGENKKEYFVTIVNIKKIEFDYKYHTEDGCEANLYINKEENKEAYKILENALENDLFCDDDDVELFDDHIMFDVGNILEIIP